MYLELTTGKDSFRAQGASPRRNVSLASFVRVADDGEGNKIIPLFVAYQRKLKYFKETSIVQSIPATSAHGPAIGGSWMVNRHEVQPGTEILLEYRQRDSTPGSFGERIEYLMIVANPDGALYSSSLHLPYHHLSAVPYIFFTGRFDVIDKDEQLPSAAIPIWKDFLNLDGDLHVSDLLDPNQDEKFWAFETLEPAVRRTKKVEKTVDSKGNERIRIKRVRNIRVR